MVDMGALQWATEPYFSGIPGLPDDRKFEILDFRGFEAIAIFCSKLNSLESASLWSPNTIAPLIATHTTAINKNHKMEAGWERESCHGTI
jgi:hypothetical protein